MGKHWGSQFVPSYPSSVTFRDQVLWDEVVEQSYGMNATAALVLSQVDGRRSIREIAETISKDTGAALCEVLDGTTNLILGLNKAYLVNIRNPRIRDDIWSVFAAILILLGWPVATHRTWYRWHLTGNPVIDISHLCVALWRAFRSPFLLILPLFGIPALWLGQSLLVLLFILSFVVSVAVHELGHVLALRLWRFPASDIGLVASVGSLSIIRRSAPEDVEVTVGLAGPGIATSIGLLLALLAMGRGQEWVWAIALPFLLQPLTLLPIFDDNRILQRSVVATVHNHRLKTLGGELMKGLGNLILRWVMNLASIYVGFIVLSFLVSITADIAGWSSFALRAGPVEFYKFVKEPDGFHGGLGGGTFWLAVMLSVVAVFLARRAQRHAKPS